MTYPTEAVEAFDPISEAITEWFGDRCPDFHPDCAACQAWADYDSLRAALDRAEADKAAAVEAAAQIAQDKSSELLAKADRVKVVAGDLYRHRALIVSAQVAADIAAAIREAPQ